MSFVRSHESLIRTLGATTAVAFSSPRAVAGEPSTADVAKCRLKPFSRKDDYGVVPFTEEQWQQLEQTFASGDQAVEEREEVRPMEGARHRRSEGMKDPPGQGEAFKRRFRD